MIETKFKHTEIGLIPHDWDVKRVSEVSENFTGLTYHPENVAKFGTLVLRSSNIQNNVLTFDDNVFVNMDIPPRATAKSGDVLVCVRNGSSQLIGKSALITPKADGMAFGAFMTVLRATSINNDYLLHSWRYKGTQEQIHETFGATINQITSKDFDRILLPVPSSIAEQERIADALSKIDSLIVGLDELLEKKRAIKTGTMQQLLTGKKRLKGFTGEWDEVELGKILAYEQPTKYIVSSTEYAPDGIPVLTAGKTFILGYTHEEKGIYSNTPVIIFDDFVTESKYVDFPFKVKSSAIKMLQLRDNVNNLRLVYEMMQMIDFPVVDHKRWWISQYSKQIIKLPRPEEQNAIASVLSSMDMEIAALEQKRDKYIAIKQGMMQNLLTGKIRLV